MEEYLEEVLRLRDASDLKDTREQITACFENVRCYLMTHPGRAVTKKKYEGEIDPIDPVFKELMDRFCTRVFQNLVPKSIHSRELTAMELGAYMQNYAKMFEKGAAQFPEAATMLEATSNANNTNALNLTMKKYKEEMDSVAGVQQTDYMNSELLEEFHRTILSKSMRSFDDIACFGSTRAIEDARREALESINENFVVYAQLNESKNPLAGFATYIVPLVIGFLSIVLRWTADWTCSSWSQTCKAGSEFLSHVYQVVFFFLVIVASTKAKQLSDAGGRLKKAWEVMNSGGASATKKDN
jgi:atlastin